MDHNINSTFSIFVFDDGNEKYEKLPNVWRIIKTGKGKCSIVNEKENVTIQSISEWKLLETV